MTGMIFTDFQDKRLPLLGFGAMRLPVTGDGAVDERAVEEMVGYAMDHGVNYFDTAYPYHGGMSERVMGKVLGKYPRESYYLADKYPGHQIFASYDPAAMFEQQLEKCGVEYFDFYLLHNVYEKSIETYLDPRWGILDYFREQKRLGRIRHLGFSSHGRVELLERFLDICGEDMEFCQIQLNYLDWTLQDAKAKYDLLTRRGIPVWVMEPVRGGRLVNLKPEAARELQALRPEESVAAWGFRFLQGLPNVKMILSGMSNMTQLQENIETFSQRKPLNQAETQAVFSVAEGLKNTVPCTACRYCVDGCPMGLDIPTYISVLNDLRFAPVTNSAMVVEFAPKEKKPDACIACGKCVKICPQNIDIPAAMRELADTVAGIPSWREVCRQREEEQKRGAAKL
jgi:predicted aldo/keto reductase-like oxidoreductase